MTRTLRPLPRMAERCISSSNLKPLYSRRSALSRATVVEDGFPKGVCDTLIDRSSGVLHEGALQLYGGTRPQRSLTEEAKSSEYTRRHGLCPCHCCMLVSTSAEQKVRKPIDDSHSCKGGAQTSVRSNLKEILPMNERRIYPQIRGYTWSRRMADKI